MREYIDIVTEVSKPEQQTAEDMLLANGYEMLGYGGTHGVVFRKNGVKGVVKLFDAYDRAYRDFVALVQANPNPHFPRFGKLQKITDEYYAIRMEELREIRKTALEEVADHVYIYCRGYGQDLTVYTKDFQSDFSAASAYMDQHPDLKHACELIVAKLFPKYRNDLRYDNMMVRGETLVITDPVNIG